MPVDRGLCPLCNGRTAACLLVTSGSANANHLVEAHSLEKNLLGYSVRMCEIEPRVCTRCGFVSMFGLAPSQFTPDV